MKIEIPERYMRPTDEDRELEKVEDKITFLAEELSETKKQLDREKKRGRLRMLKEQLQRLEMDLQLARNEERYLLKKIYGGTNNV